MATINDELAAQRAALEKEVFRLEELLSANPDWRTLRALESGLSAGLYRGADLTAVNARRSALHQRLAANRIFEAYLRLREAADLMRDEESQGRDRAREATSTAHQPDQSPPASRHEPFRTRLKVTIHEDVPGRSAPKAARANTVRDDLTRIRGIDRQLAARLDGLGVTTWDEIAAWRREDIRALSAALGLEGRISRENWIEQAAVLALHRQPPASVDAKAGPERAAADGSPAVDDARTVTPAAEAASSIGAVPPPTASPTALRELQPAAGPDDLTLIDAIDAQLATALVTTGITRFAQIASWRVDDVADVSVALRLGERICREGWIEQAALLATGVRTDYARRRHLAPRLAPPSAYVAELRPDPAFRERIDALSRQRLEEQAASDVPPAGETPVTGQASAAGVPSTASVQPEPETSAPPARIFAVPALAALTAANDPGAPGAPLAPAAAASHADDAAGAIRPEPAGAAEPDIAELSTAEPAPGPEAAEPEAVQSSPGLERHEPESVAIGEDDGGGAEDTAAIPDEGGGPPAAVEPVASEPRASEPRASEPPAAKPGADAPRAGASRPRDDYDLIATGFEHGQRAAPLPAPLEIARRELEPQEPAAHADTAVAMIETSAPPPDPVARSMVGMSEQPAETAPPPDRASSASEPAAISAEATTTAKTVNAATRTAPASETGEEAAPRAGGQSAAIDAPAAYPAADPVAPAGEAEEAEVEIRPAAAHRIAAVASGGPAATSPVETGPLAFEVEEATVEIVARAPLRRDAAASPDSSATAEAVSQPTLRRFLRVFEGP